jgi:uncharacterized protein
MSDAEFEKLRDALAEFEKENYSVAFKLLRPLAEAGNPQAQCSLASLYHLGLGVEADGRKATELYRATATQNIREGQLSGLAYSNLSAIYGTGAPGVERNLELARECRRLAKELGFPM